MSENSKAVRVLTMNTLAFTVCFACWMMNGVLVTFLVDNAVYDWSKVQMGWLIGIPVLTGSLTRLPVGVLTDKYGGRRVYTVLMLLAAVPLWRLSYADSYSGFLLASLGFGLAGASFAVGIAYTSVWFARKHQGTALG
ncbi:MAG TPA: MFS transporter, partial [Planctomycetota bacterium]